MSNKIKQYFLINVAVVFSAILNLFEFIKCSIIQVLKTPEKIVYMFVGMVWILLCLMAVFMESRNDWRVGTVAIGTVILLFLAKIITVVFTYVCVTVCIIFERLSFQTIIAKLNIFVIKKFSDLISDYERIDVNEKLYLFPTYLIYYILKNVARFGSAICVILFFVLTIGAGYFGYWLAFVDAIPPTVGDAEYYLSYYWIFVCAMVGCYAAYCIAIAIKESYEYSDFGLHEILENHLNCFYNNDNSTEKTTDMDYDKEVKYFKEFFSKFTSKKEMRQAYIVLVKKYHPDENREIDAQVANRKSTAINVAYEETVKSFGQYY